MFWLSFILERILSLDPPVSKQITGDNLGYDRAGPVPFLGDVRKDAVDHDPVLACQWPPESEGHEPLGQVAGQVFFLLSKEFLKLCRGGEISTIWQLACGVDG